MNHDKSLLRWRGWVLVTALAAGCAAPEYQPPLPPVSVPARVVKPAPAPPPQPPPSLPETPVPPPEIPQPQVPPPPSAGATSALLQQGRQQAAAGDYALATASIERALRINPRDYALWLELGRLKLAEGDRTQAQNMARRALALAGNDPARRAECEALLEAAQR
jgi:hypothetical protein